MKITYTEEQVKELIEANDFYSLLTEEGNIEVSSFEDSESWGVFEKLGKHFTFRFFEK